MQHSSKSLDKTRGGKHAQQCSVDMHTEGERAVESANACVKADRMPLTKTDMTLLSCATEPSSCADHLLLRLQRQYGNQYVQRVLALKGKNKNQPKTTEVMKQVPQQRQSVLPGSNLWARQGGISPRLNPWAQGTAVQLKGVGWTPNQTAPVGLIQRQGVKQAKKDYAKFIASGPYRTNNFTKGINGKFDAIYNPGAKLLNINVKVKFTFPNDPPAINPAARVLQIIRHATYAQKFISQIESSWSGRYQFKNVRSPQSVWGKLNPVSVKVDVVPVSVGQHFTIKARPKTKGGAQVAGSVVKLYKGDLTPQVGFQQAATKAGELTRLNRITPSPIYFANDSAVVRSRYRRRLKFMATYLKRINDPRFNIKITGHASATGGAAYNMDLSKRRAQAVENELKAGGATNHNLVTAWKGFAGATTSWKWRKVVIVPEIPAGWKNVFKTAVHEFGHMVGLGDEYWQSAGKPTRPTHYGLVRKAFGRKYANQVVGKRGTPDSASVMHFGSDIRIYHYVTFWSALAETTLRKTPVPTPRFGYKDWKFIG